MPNFLDDDAISSVLRAKFGEYWERLEPAHRDVAQKVAVLVEKAGGRSSAAEAMGVGATTLDNYRQGKTQPKFLELIRLAKAAGEAPERLIHSMDDWSGTASVASQEEPQRFINLPMYPERAAAGSGLVKVDEIHTSFLSFEERWLRDLGATPATCFLVTATGDSMFPTIPDGAAMICDGSKTDVQNGFVYAFDVDGDLIVKRAERLLDGTVDLISDNKEKYPPRNYKASMVKKMNVLGRIMYVGRPL